MRQLCFLMAALAFVFAGSAKADIIFSTSSTNPSAGTALTLNNVGDTGSIYVYFSTHEGMILDGVSMSVDSSEAAVLQATAHTIENPGNARWTQTQQGVLGDLVFNFGAAAFPPLGLGTNGPADFILFSTIQFQATAEGTTALTFSRGLGNQALHYRGVTGDQWDNFNKGTATVTVGAIPEPSTAAALLLATTLGLLGRRRK